MKLIFSFVTVFLWSPVYYQLHRLDTLTVGGQFTQSSIHYVGLYTLGLLYVFTIQFNAYDPIEDAIIIRLVVLIKGNVLALDIK